MYRERKFLWSLKQVFKIRFPTVSYCLILFRTILRIFPLLFLHFRENYLDVNNFNICRDMDLVMYGRPELMFKASLSHSAIIKLIQWDSSHFLFCFWKNCPGPCWRNALSGKHHSIIRAWSPSKAWKHHARRNPQSCLVQSAVSFLLHGRERSPNYFAISQR
jgi:hypothetical protein